MTKRHVFIHTQIFFFLVALPLTRTLIKTLSICFLTVSPPARCPHKRQEPYKERWPWEPMRGFVCLPLNQALYSCENALILCTMSMVTYAKVWECVWVCMSIWMNVGSSILNLYCHSEHVGGSLCNSPLAVNMHRLKGPDDRSCRFSS